MVIDWTTAPGAAVEDPVTHFAYGWATQVAMLDDDGRIAKVVAAHDVGKVINPTLLEGQIEGPCTWAWGTPVRGVRGRRRDPVTTTLKSLNIIPPAGMPPVECLFVEEHQPEGPTARRGRRDRPGPHRRAVAGALRALRGPCRTRLPMKDSPAAAAAVPSWRAADEHPCAVRGHVMLGLDPAEPASADLVIGGDRILAVGPAPRGVPRRDAPARWCCRQRLRAPPPVLRLSRGMPYRLAPPGNFLQILQRVWWRLDRALDEVPPAVGPGRRAGGAAGRDDDGRRPSRVAELHRRLTRRHAAALASSGCARCCATR